MLIHGNFRQLVDNFPFNTLRDGFGGGATTILEIECESRPHRRRLILIGWTLPAGAISKRTNWLSLRIGSSTPTAAFAVRLAALAALSAALAALVASPIPCFM